MNYSARGFGRSCGVADSRTSPHCDRGWLHLADHRYEARDTQHLLGLLVDQGVTSPTAIGVTGVSYGGIQTLNLARLRNRVRLEDGSFVPWTSPNGTPLSITAGLRALGGLGPHLRAPAERALPRLPDAEAEPAIRPGGVMKKSYNDVLYASRHASGFYAPPGGAVRLRHHDLEGARRPRRARDAGDARRGQGAHRFHSWMGLTGPSAALLVQNGWTDDLFPAPEALRVYRTFQAAPGARLSLQLGDLGHPRGTNERRAHGKMLARRSGSSAST